MVDLREASGTARGSGVAWTLESGDDLNANLVRPAGGCVGEHVNDEVDVVFVGVSGSGFVSVDGEEFALSDGTLVFVPKGARRSIWSSSEDFCYLTVHRRRGPIRLGGRARGKGGGERETASESRGAL